MPLSDASVELLDQISIQLKGIELYKQNAALRYAESNVEADRAEFQKYAYAEQQLTHIKKLVTEGVIAIHLETEAKVATVEKQLKGA